LGYGLWAVEERQSSAVIGRIGLIYPEGWPGLEIGWALAQSHWGKGYATEGAKAAVNWAFEHLEIDELISLIDPENVKSASVAERIGETLKEQIVFRGKPINVYALQKAAV
jgi:RimJ/RimL family protein N-acetyltransferase